MTEKIKLCLSDPYNKNLYYKKAPFLTSSCVQQGTAPPIYSSNVYDFDRQPILKLQLQQRYNEIYNSHSITEPWGYSNCYLGKYSSSSSNSNVCQCAPHYSAQFAKYK